MGGGGSIHVTAMVEAWGGRSEFKRVPVNLDSGNVCSGCVPFHPACPLGFGHCLLCPKRYLLPE